MTKDLINWYSWDDEALTKAKNENKSIFLFIEDTHSKWSQRMKEESFTNEVITELLNERFVPILVQKDERPDIERYYQKIYALMNRQVAGSPLSIFLTQELQPFYAGSYISPQEVDAQLGFEALLRVISKKQITDYETLAKKGDEVLTFIEPKEENIQATKLHLSVMQTISLHTQTLLDKEHGGFTKAPKFPNTSLLELLLDLYQLENDLNILNAITLTLNKMSESTFYDIKNGGFYSYSEDKTWNNASGGKTLYNNALLAQLYLRTYSICDDENYKKIAFSTIEFMLQLEDELSTTSENALLVQTLFKASHFDSKYKIIALEKLESILSELYINGTLYHCKKSQESAKIKAFLEDYSYLGETLIVAYQETLDESFLIMATQFSNILIEQFYEQGRWIYSSNSFKTRESIHDNNLPSSVATALSLLMSISSLVDTNYKKFVFKTLELHSYSLMRQPLSSPKLSQILLRYLKDDRIIKSNETLLKENIDKRKTIRYPYILFKTALDDNFELCNSHSSIIKEKNFEKLVSHLESTL